MTSDARGSRAVGVRDAVAGLAANPRRTLFDVAAVATWVLAVAAALHDLALPEWLYYAVVLAGVVGYTLLAARAESLAARTRPRRRRRRERDANP